MENRKQTEIEQEEFEPPLYDRPISERVAARFLSGFLALVAWGALSFGLYVYWSLDVSVLNLLIFSSPVSFVGGFALGPRLIKVLLWPFHYLF